MKVGAIVQARMSSSRLPGKVLRCIEGKPLLQYLLERLVRSKRLTSIVVATSIKDDDDPVLEFCEQYGVTCLRGSLEDVAGRFMGVLDAEGLDAFVRINGDSPLLDTRIVDCGVKLFLQEDVDLVTNVWPRTFPKGQSVEVIRASVFKEGYACMEEAGDFEHVTPFFYRHPDLYRIRNFVSAGQYGDMSLAVDTVKDLQRVEAMIQRMTRPHWTYHLEDVLHLASRVQTGGELQGACE